MKTEYTEKIPALRIKHKLIICDNPKCKKVIRDKREIDYCLVCDKRFDVDLEDHYQGGDKDGKLLDACSERCLKIATKQP